MRRWSLRATLVTLVVASVAVVWVWQHLRARRLRPNPNERSASASILTVTTAQAHLHREDSDGNGVNDFWVADISGFKRILQRGRGTPINLIEPSVAWADWQPLLSTRRAGTVPLSGSAVEYEGFETGALPKDGYWYVALREYEESPGAWVKYDDGRGRNAKRFGVCQYPAVYGGRTTMTVIANESFVLYWKDTKGVPPRGFPLEPEKEGWRRAD